MFGCLPWWVNIEWRTRKRVMLLLCAFEFAPTIAALTLFGIADPDTYRTKLWQEGANHGWNSDPIELLYAAANYKPIKAPTPWNQFTTDWGLVISVLSTFILLVKIVMYLTHVFPPILSAILHGALVIVWSYAVSLQAASDYTDPTAPSAHPYYLTRGCGAPVDPAVQGYCRQAMGAFAVSCVQIFLFLVFFVFSVISAFPSDEQKKEHAEAEREAQEWRDIENYENKDFEQELDQMHAPPEMMGQAYGYGQQPSGNGVFQAYPMSPAKSAFGVHVMEGQYGPGPMPMPSEGRMSMSSTATGSTGQMARPNKDLPLRHHITSDVYA